MPPGRAVNGMMSFRGLGERGQGVRHPACAGSSSAASFLRAVEGLQESGRGPFLLRTNGSKGRRQGTKDVELSFDRKW